MVSPCVIPCYKIIPIQNSVRAQDDYFSGLNRLLEKVIKMLLIIHRRLMNLNVSTKTSHMYIRGMILKLPPKHFKYMLEIFLQKNHPIISFIM